MGEQHAVRQRRNLLGLPASYLIHQFQSTVPSYAASVERLSSRCLGCLLGLWGGDCFKISGNFPQSPTLSLHLQGRPQTVHFQLVVFQAGTIQAAGFDELSELAIREAMLLAERLLGHPH